jgi:indolepyruvate ferredoxin oxidoreductase beta subunit
MVSMVRFGENVFSPIFEQGEGDFLVGLELLETLRNIHLLSKDGAVIVCDVLVPPALAIAKGEKWPSKEQCLKTLKENVSTVLVIRRRDILSKIASPIMANMVAIGALAGVLGEKIPVEKFIESIKLLLPNPARNINAFKIGLELAGVNTGCLT